MTLLALNKWAQIATFSSSLIWVYKVYHGTSIRIPSITKTCLYNFDPLKPHFYIVNLGFTGVYIFLISAQKHRLWVHRLIKAVLMSTHMLYFEQKYENYQNFLSENFQFLVVKFSIYLNRHVFVIG